MDCPPPGEWHPWYRDKPWLAAWLDSGEHYVDLVIQPVKAHEIWGYLAGPGTPSDKQPQRLTMTKHRAAARAPYVGEPFVYAWTVGTDQYGRSIATEAQIVYTSR